MGGRAAAMGIGWDGTKTGEGFQELTEAIRPVEEAAATARLDCRRAFLNIMIKGEGGFREEREGESLKGVWWKRRKKEERGRRGREERSFSGRVSQQD